MNKYLPPWGFQIIAPFAMRRTGTIVITLGSLEETLSIPRRLPHTKQHFQACRVDRRELTALLCSSFLRADTEVFSSSPPPHPHPRKKRKPPQINFPKPTPSDLPVPAYPFPCVKKHLPIISTLWKEHHTNPLKPTFLQRGAHSCEFVLFTAGSLRQHTQTPLPCCQDKA